MRKVLIITYYWPPSGGAGVQRWLKFVKYLPELGWQPVVFAPENAEYPVEDPTLTDEVPDGIEVIKYPIREPRRWFKWLSRKEKLGADTRKDHLDKIWSIPREQQTWKQRLAVWVRSNFLIPDARALWIRPAARFLVKYLKEHPVDVIVSNGPPHSTHLIALKVKKKIGIPWLADFRDPWTQIDFFDKMRLTEWARRRHFTLERKVICEADAVTTVSQSIATQMEEMSSRNVEVVLNGFDPEDFPEYDTQKNEKFTISYIGTMSEDRNAPELWEAIQSLSKSNRQFEGAYQLLFAGNIDPRIFDQLESRNLEYQYMGYLNHQEAIKTMVRSHVLLLVQNRVGGQKAGIIQKGIVTGKVFEYLASGTCILFIGDQDSDVARILSDIQGNLICDFDTIKLEELLRIGFKRFKDGKLHCNTSELLEKYTRESQCKKVVALLNNLE